MTYILFLSSEIGTYQATGIYSHFLFRPYMTLSPPSPPRLQGLPERDLAIREEKKKLTFQSCQLFLELFLLGHQLVELLDGVLEVAGLGAKGKLLN